ncbi:MFS transporter, partial [Streptomyces albidoflavus]|nr:MFS transporter [Streptomyces albidoflavus]
MLAVPEFRALLLAQTLATCGTVVVQTTLSVLVYARTGSALLASLAFALGFTPYLFGATLLSAVADRCPARDVLVVCQALSCAVAAAMALPGLPVPVLLALVLVLGVAAPVFQGARAAALPDLLPDGGYPLGRSLLRLVAQSTQVAGFAVGGLLLLAVPAAHALLASAAVQAGRLAVLTARHTPVFAQLADEAERWAAMRPGAALDLVANAAVVRFYSGEDSQRRRVQELLRHLPDDGPHAATHGWARAVADPFTDRDRLVALLPRLAVEAEAEARPERLTAVGIMAWLLDETPRAVRAFDEALGRREAWGALPEGLGGAVAWAYLERGRWDQARTVCARVLAVGRAAGLDHAVACAAAVDATVLALQGDTA